MFEARPKKTKEKQNIHTNSLWFGTRTTDSFIHSFSPACWKLCFVLHLIPRTIGFFPSSYRNMGFYIFRRIRREITDERVEKEKKQKTLSSTGSLAILSTRSSPPTLDIIFYSLFILSFFPSFALTSNSAWIFFHSSRNVEKWMNEKCEKYINAYDREWNIALLLDQTSRGEGSFYPLFLLFTIIHAPPSDPKHSSCFPTLASMSYSDSSNTRKTALATKKILKKTLSEINFRLCWWHEESAFRAKYISISIRHFT